MRIDASIKTARFTLEKNFSVLLFEMMRKIAVNGILVTGGFDEKENRLQFHS